MAITHALNAASSGEPTHAGIDLVELYFERGWTDGLPVYRRPLIKLMPLSQRSVIIGTMSSAKWRPVGGRSRARFSLSTWSWQAASPSMLLLFEPLCWPHGPCLHLNGVQATTHVAAPLVIVNGPIARKIGMNGGANAFGPGNRANATIGRAIRLIMLNVGGGHAPDLDKCTLGNPARYSYCICENEDDSPLAPYHVEQGICPRTPPSSPSPPRHHTA